MNPCVLTLIRIASRMPKPAITAVNITAYPEVFYKSEEVKKITGVEFSSQREYTNWSRENELTDAPYRWQ